MAKKKSAESGIRKLRLTGGPCDGSVLLWRGKRLPMQLQVHLEAFDSLEFMPNCGQFAEYAINSSDEDAAEFCWVGGPAVEPAAQLSIVSEGA